MKNNKLAFNSIFCSLILATTASAGANPNKNIVGGEEAIPHHYPFMASLQYKSDNFHFCGGSLLNENTIVTAAHCVYFGSADNLQVVLGDHNLFLFEGSEQVIDVAEIVVHPEYSSHDQGSDVAILKLATPAVLNEFVGTINLPDQGEESEGTTTTIGWGALSSGGSSPDVLNEVKVDIVPFEDCQENYGSDSIIEGMLCASAPGKDSCQGDSGGPLFQDNKLLGLTSWGYGCAMPNYPGVYTQVSTYVDFIKENS